MRFSLAAASDDWFLSRSGVSEVHVYWRLITPTLVVSRAAPALDPKKYKHGRHVLRDAFHPQLDERSRTRGAVAASEKKRTAGNRAKRESRLSWRRARSINRNAY